MGIEGKMGIDIPPTFKNGFEGKTVLYITDPRFIQLRKINPDGYRHLVNEIVGGHFEQEGMEINRIEIDNFGTALDGEIRVDVKYRPKEN